MHRTMACVFTRQNYEELRGILTRNECEPTGDIEECATYAPPASVCFGGTPENDKCFW
jgi:hypothetical protein